ncbi:SAM-dependent methyltransferase [Candidatus Scalindua japonica]|uniref:SAM-dependent methyltransferase n=1 Tax=Candidatus Scalindua japonica TaxID=1284222 RepID=A0A286U1X7_9BACT|nr:methyltransferase domain-containing protein [Candidatus Scalindua japonica]GAX62127.1 SAM-dependent methyltransferase [Candidatus Scalindua japonica]
MQIKNNDIVEYYRKNELSYHLWGRNYHYGYWDGTTNHLFKATQKLNEVMAQIACIRKGDRVLDAGCGAGGSSTYLAKNFGCHVTGITICPRQVDFANRNAKKDGIDQLTEFLEMDYIKTEFAENQFDVVWGVESVCHADGKDRFIREAYRVLKDGGRLIVADGFASKKDYNHAEQRSMDKWVKGWAVNYLETPENFIKFSSETGFQNSNYRDITKNVFPTAKLMYYLALPFIPFHLFDKIFPLKSYPLEMWFHQYEALKNGLWEYGIFNAKKCIAESQLKSNSL